MALPLPGRPHLDFSCAPLYKGKVQASPLGLKFIILTLGDYCENLIKTTAPFYTCEMVKKYIHAIKNMELDFGKILSLSGGGGIRRVAACEFW